MLGFIVSCEWIPDCTWLCGDDFIISPVCIIGMTLSKPQWCILIKCVLRMDSRLHLVEVVLFVDVKYLSHSSP